MPARAPWSRVPLATETTGIVIPGSLGIGATGESFAEVAPRIWAARATLVKKQLSEGTNKIKPLLDSTSRNPLSDGNRKEFLCQTAIVKKLFVKRQQSVSQQTLCQRIPHSYRQLRALYIPTVTIYLGARAAVLANLVMRLINYLCTPREAEPAFLPPTMMNPPCRSLRPARRIVTHHRGSPSAARKRRTTRRW